MGLRSQNRRSPAPHEPAVPCGRQCRLGHQDTSPITGISPQPEHPGPSQLGGLSYEGRAHSQRQAANACSQRMTSVINAESPWTCEATDHTPELVDMHVLAGTP